MTDLVKQGFWGCGAQMSDDCELHIINKSCTIKKTYKKAEFNVKTINFLHIYNFSIDILCGLILVTFCFLAIIVFVDNCKNKFQTAE